MRSGWWGGTGVCVRAWCTIVNFRSVVLFFEVREKNVKSFKCDSNWQRWPLVLLEHLPQYMCVFRRDAIIRILCSLSCAFKFKCVVLFFQQDFLWWLPRPKTDQLKSRLVSSFSLSYASDSIFLISTFLFLSFLSLTHCVCKFDDILNM